MDTFEAIQAARTLRQHASDDEHGIPDIVQALKARGARVYTGDTASKDMDGLIVYKRTDVPEFFADNRFNIERVKLTLAVLAGKLVDRFGLAWSQPEGYTIVLRNVSWEDVMGETVESVVAQELMMPVSATVRLVDKYGALRTADTFGVPIEVLRNRMNHLGIDEYCPKSASRVHWSHDHTDPDPPEDHP